MLKLCLAAVALLLAGCGSTTTRTVTTTLSTTTQADISTATALTLSSNIKTPLHVQPDTRHLSIFQSPSHNIGCQIVAGTARCDIKHRTWGPGVRPKDCPDIVDYGQGLIVGRSGRGRFVCAGDTALVPAARVLRYRVDSLAGGFRCRSRVTGVTCVNTRTGHGFNIAYGSYSTF